MTSQNEDEFLKQIEEETKFITDYLDSQKLINSTLQQDIEPQVDLSNFSTHIQPTNKLENIYYMEVNFVQDINAQMLLQDKLINIANMGIVPSSVLLQIIESTMQTEDSNQHSLMYKIVRNAAQNQKIVPSDENEILEISDQEDLLEMLKISDTFKDLEVIVESKIELEGYTEYQIKVSEDLKYRVLITKKSQSISFMRNVTKQLHSNQLMKHLQNDNVFIKIYEEILVINPQSQLYPIQAYITITESFNESFNDKIEQISRINCGSQDSITMLYFILKMSEIQEFFMQNNMYSQDLFLDQRCLFITSEGQIKLINSKEIVNFQDLNSQNERNEIQQQLITDLIKFVQNFQQQKSIKALDSLEQQNITQNQSSLQLLLNELQKEEDVSSFTIKDLCIFIAELLVKNTKSFLQELELNTQLNQSYHLDNEINFTYQFLLNSQYRNHFKSVMNRTEDNLEYKYLFQNSQSFFGKKEQESVIAQRQVKNLLQAKGKCIFNDQDLNIYPMVKIIDEYITLDQQANNKIDFMRAVILLLKNSPLKNQQQFHKEFKQMLYNMTYTLFDFNKFRDLTQNYTQIPEQLLVKNQDLNVVESPEFNDEFVLQEIQLITEFHIICLFKIQQTDAKEMQKNMADIINVLNLKISQSLNVKYYYLLMKDLNKKNQLKKSLQVFKLLQTFQNIQDQHVFIELSQTLEISYLIIKSYLWAIKVNIMNNCEKEELEELMLKAEQNVEIYHKLMKQCVLNSDKGLDRYFIHLELVKLIQLYQEVLKEDIFDKQLPEIVKRVVYLKENDGSLKFIDKLSLIQIEVKIIESGYETTFNSTIEDIITQLKEIIITQSQKKPYKFLALSILFRIYLNNIDYQIFAFKLLDSFLVDDHNEANPNLNSSSLFKLQCAIIQFHQDQSQNDIDDSDSDSDSDLEAVEHIKSQAIFKDDTMLQKLIHSFIQADCIQRIGEKQELKEGANYYYQALMRYLCYGEMDYNKDVLEDVRNPKSLGEKVLNVVKYSQIRQNGNNQIE